MKVAEITCKYSNRIVFLRWLATFIDYLIFACIYYLTFLFLHGLNQKVIIFILSCATILYYLLLESKFGFTIGKLIMGIQVVDEEFNIPKFSMIMIRFLFRFIEINPIWLGGLPAFIIAWNSKNKQRLGDMIAKTYVVYKKDIEKSNNENAIEVRAIEDGMWICKKCKQANKQMSMYCKSCGEYK